MAPNLELRLLERPNRLGSTFVPPDIHATSMQAAPACRIVHTFSPRSRRDIFLHSPPRRAHPSNNRAPHPRHSAEHLSISSTRANVEPTAGFGHGHQSSSYYFRWTYHWHEPSSSTTVGASSDISALLSQRAVKPDSKRSIRLHPSTYYNCQEI